MNGHRFQLDSLTQPAVTAGARLLQPQHFASLSRPSLCEPLGAVAPAAAGTAALRFLAVVLPAVWFVAASCTEAQTNQRSADPSFASSNAGARGAGTAGQATTQQHAEAASALSEQIRTACIQGRRCVCGRILKVLPSGLVIESGYTSLLRTNFQGAWLIPGTAVASREPNLAETQEPGSVCGGTVFLTDLPRLRGARINRYDYVVLTAYPAGQYTYTSVGDIRRTVRRFSAGLETAVKLTLESGNR